MWNYVTKGHLWIVNQCGQGPFVNDEIIRPRADVWNMNLYYCKLVNQKEPKVYVMSCKLWTQGLFSEYVEFLGQGPHYDGYKPIT